MERRDVHLALVLLSCLAVTSVEANYTLEILIESYQNPTHQSLRWATVRFGCCDVDSALPCKACDNAFRLCVREEITGLVEGACNIAVLDTNLIALENDDLMFSMGDNIGNLSNPLIVSGEEWPGSVEIVFTVYDLDGTATIEPASDVVDNVILHPTVSPVLSSSDPFTETMRHNGTYSIVTVAFRLTCGPDHYGPDCSFCRETNDSSGHFSCNKTVGKVCLEGYQNLEANCVECIPSVGCSAEGGYCNQPGECQCREGFSGENCEDHVCDHQPCSIGGSCSFDPSTLLNYTCMCFDGFTGDICEDHPCDHQPCSNGGSCSFSASRPLNYSCACVEGFTGENCEDHPCDNQTCSNRGQCTLNASRPLNYSCVCMEDFTGENCEVHPCQTCSDEGHCSFNASSPSCMCMEEFTGGKCDERIAAVCDPSCEMGLCVNNMCECDDGYSGETCDVLKSGGSNSLLVIVVAVVGGVLVILITAVLIAICVLLCRGSKLKKKDDDGTPNPYETPSNFFRKWRGNGHASNGITERKFDNPLYHERTTSPTSPPLPPRPEHPYATLEDMYDPYSQIPAELESSLDEKPRPAPSVDSMSVENACYDQPLAEAASPRPENPYLDPVKTARADNPANSSENPMNSSTVLYAHIQ